MFPLLPATLGSVETFVGGEILLAKENQGGGISFSQVSGLALILPVYKENPQMFCGHFCSS